MMDMLIIVAIGALVALAVLVTVIMLRRSWGDFPTRSSLPTMPPQPSSTGTPGSALFDMPGPVLMNEMSGGAGGLVPITNPHIRRAAEQALRQNDQAARYFMRDGEQIYFNANTIADPHERQTAYRVMQRLGTDERIDMRDIQQVLQILRRQ
jgi:hypothetical protein